MSIADNLKHIRTTIPDNVQLVCVSKFHPASVILEAYAVGERIFGESREQELRAKAAELPKDIQWHFIGHLQTNKVKTIVPVVSLIHSVDSLKLLVEINKEAGKEGRVVNCLLQLHIAQEETKFGFSFEEAEAFFQSGQLVTLSNVSVKGLMGMATFTDDRQRVQQEFQSLKRFFDHMRSTYFPDNSNFASLSMGMSDDYQLAIAEGSTMVRIGSSIFGGRI
jgi:pyridoxal phosphate enzyme (YggS family)